MLPKLQIRERIEIRISEGDGFTIFMARIQDITPKGLYIDRPAIRKRPFPVKAGDLVEIRFHRSDAEYKFSTKILDETLLDGHPALLIEPPRELTRIQRREHFRIDILLNVYFREHLLEDQETLLEFKRGWVMNLSAGGLRFVTPAQDALDIWLGTTLEVNLELSDGTEAKGVIVSVIQVGADPSDRTRTLVVGRFVEISEKSREAIITHNIRYQIKWRTEQARDS